MFMWDKFMSITNIKVGSEKTVRFWQDKWIESAAMEEFPHLYSFSKDKDMSLMKFISIFEEDMYDHFHLPLSMNAARECEELTLILQSHMDNNVYDDQ